MTWTSIHIQFVEIQQPARELSFATRVVVEKNRHDMGKALLIMIDGGSTSLDNVIDIGFALGDKCIYLCVCVYSFFFFFFIAWGTTQNPYKTLKSMIWIMRRAHTFFFFSMESIFIPASYQGIQPVSPGKEGAVSFATSPSPDHTRPHAKRKKA